eukprot:scaffold288962_cov13-Tisochrysis_lutea.AAC.1
MSSSIDSAMTINFALVIFINRLLKMLMLAERKPAKQSRADVKAACMIHKALKYGYAVKRGFRKEETCLIEHLESLKCLTACLQSTGVHTVVQQFDKSSKSATKYCEEKAERLQEQLKKLQDRKQDQQNAK